MKKNSITNGAAIRPAATATISIPLSPEEIEQLDAVAKREGKTRDALFLEAVSAFVKTGTASGEAGEVTILDDSTVCFQFDAQWDRERNTLYQDSAGHFYLASADEKFELDPDDLPPVRVTAKEAAQWWVRCCRFSEASSGDLCELVEALVNAIPAN